MNTCRITETGMSQWCCL